MPIEIAADVFAYDDDREVSNEKVIVVGAADREAARRALGAAGRWFMCVGADGRMYTDGIPEAEPGEEIYTPNYASDVTLAQRGPWLYLDCKGYIAPPMAETLKRILVEELERAGVTDARVEVPGDAEIHGGP